MKQVILNTILLLTCSLNCFAQFGADYSSYGFNFINDTYNEGLKNWTGNNINDANKFYLYQQDTLNNYALELKPVNETLSINYNDAGYMDLNPCAFKILLRVKINQYSGNNDNLSFLLYTGAKKVELEFKEDGIYYANSTNNSVFITTAAPINQWITYTLSLNSCGDGATLMLENDDSNLYTLNLPDDTSPQTINLAASTNGSALFSAEIDHLFIYSNPIKWWLGPSTEFVDDTPAGYENTTGDRQHFLSLPNGEKIGVNENGGGYITFTELTPGGPNLDPRPKFGSGGTKSLRGYFHTSKFNPVQAGISSVSGGHLVDVSTTPEKVTIETFPLHSYFQDDFTENTPLVFPSGETLGDENHPAIIDDDVYDEFGLDMRHELMSELDFNTSIENITEPSKISTVRHRAEWEYIRHPAHLLQFHEVAEHQRPKFENFSGANNDMFGADNDMGEMRHKFEFRLNYDLGYKYVLWIDDNNQWESKELDTIGAKKIITIKTDTPLEQRFLVFSTTADPNGSGAVAWFYPENDYNTNSSVGKSRDNKDIKYANDRRTEVTIRADWRKTNWCRMNLYIRNEGLIAPCNGDPTVYEAFQMEAHQLLGSPNEILDEVLSYDPTSACNTFMAVNDSNIPTKVYQAIDQIVSAGTVPAGNNVTFEAQNSVTLTPGFHAQGASNFVAKMGGCENENLQEEHYPVNNTFRVVSPNTIAEGFAVFPNPTKDKIEIVSQSAADFDVQIFDLRGVEVLRKAFDQQAAVLDIQHFTKGLYFVNFTNLTTGKQFHKTIVKQ